MVVANLKIGDMKIIRTFFLKDVYVHGHAYVCVSVYMGVSFYVFFWNQTQNLTHAIHVLYPWTISQDTKYLFLSTAWKWVFFKFFILGKVLDKVLEDLKAQVYLGDRKESVMGKQKYTSAWNIKMALGFFVQNLLFIYLDFHGAGSQGGDFFLHAISNTRVHGGTSR